MSDRFLDLSITVCDCLLAICAGVIVLGLMSGITHVGAVCGG